MKIKLLPLFVIFVSLLALNTAKASTLYLYMENPDPEKYTIQQESGPNLNCSEEQTVMGNKFETKGWIRHGLGERVIVSIVNKKDPSIKCTATLKTEDGGDELDYNPENCAMVSSGATYWVTIRNTESKYQPYKTWACG